MIQVNRRDLVGRMAFSIKVPKRLIREGDDVVDITVDAVLQAVGEDAIEDGDIFAVTEAVLAISQSNYATPEQVSKCISNLYGSGRLALVGPIQSRNRFLSILEAIVRAEVKEILIFMTYPSDEVGNHLIPKKVFYEKGDHGVLTLKEFTEIYGEPHHMFTGENYPRMYEEAGKGKVKVLFCNEYSLITEYCNQALVCNIHDRDIIKEILLNPGESKRGMDTVYTLADIMKESIDNSGNSEYGLYGSNMMNGFLKLMPKNGQETAERIQQVVKEKTGKTVEAIVFGDGCFKDPIGGIWELADPEPSLGATSRLKELPMEIKLKLFASQHPDKSEEEIWQMVLEEKKRRQNANISDKASLGTTPRRKDGLVASLCDLMVGSGDQGTPIVYLKGYLD